MPPTVDDFRALARSSPWRWTTLHLEHRSRFPGECEAWVRRPGELLVRQPPQPDAYVAGLPYTVSSVRVAGAGEAPPPQPRRTLPHEVSPSLRADGLVAERPTDQWLDYDDPMYGNYSWVAMLDPVELSHHVDVKGLRVVDVAGRPAWRCGPARASRLPAALRRQLLRAHLQRGGAAVRLHAPGGRARGMAGAALPRPLRRGARRGDRRGGALPAGRGATRCAVAGERPPRGRHRSGRRLRRPRLTDFCGAVATSAVLWGDLCGDNPALLGGPRQSSASRPHPVRGLRTSAQARAPRTAGSWRMAVPEGFAWLRFVG